MNISGPLYRCKTFFVKTVTFRPSPFAHWSPPRRETLAFGPTIPEKPFSGQKLGGAFLPNGPQMEITRALNLPLALGGPGKRGLTFSYRFRIGKLDAAEEVDQAFYIVQCVQIIFLMKRTILGTIQGDSILVPWARKFERGFAPARVSG